MRKLTNKEFSTLFNFIKNDVYSNANQIRTNRTNTSLYPTVELAQFTDYNFTSKQIREIYDWFLEDGNDTIRLDAFFSINNLLEDNIALDDYKYYLDKLVNVKMSDYYYQYLYLNYHSYDSEEYKKEEPYITLTYQYLEKLKFTDINHLKYCLRNFARRRQSRDYKFHDYNFAFLFNEELEILIKSGLKINYEDFFMEDNIEEYLEK